MTKNVLERFRPQVRAWFEDVFAAPTAVQSEAWEAISAGHHALVVAPTGSGKTLAAFLWALNALVEREQQLALDLLPGVASGSDSSAGGVSGGGVPGGGVRVLYISPLKALGVDVENNLRAPLNGIARTAQRLGQPVPDITVGVRSGDTPQSERNRQVRRPPDILITTPESAYLMLTSKAAGILKTVDTVIIDEIHALAGTKRGVHLALTLERLAEIAGDFQRIGLSATVRPLEEVAHFLGGTAGHGSHAAVEASAEGERETGEFLAVPRPVDIIAPPGEKQWDLEIHVPVEDMSDLPTPEVGSTIGEFTIDDPLGLSSAQGVFDDSALRAGTGQQEGSNVGSPLEQPGPAQKSIWPFIEQALYDEVMAHRSTLVFVNSRRSAEKITSRLNELYAAQYAPETLAPPTRRDPAQVMAQSDVAGSAPAFIARAHHGSVSKDERLLTETMLKEGALKAVVATSSLELGIDMGAVDLVVQVESPPSVASALQRVGRAGHSVGAVSQGSFYPKHRADALASAVTVRRMRAGLIESLHTPTNPLDVLAQQTVAEVASASVRGETVNADAWFATVRRAWPYRDLTRGVFDSVIDLLSGVYPSTDFAELKPRIIFDRVSGELSARPGAQRVAVTSGGTIPDRGMFGVFLVAGGEGSAPRRVGELDEEMVYESRVGDIFTLGASSWRIEDITRDQVLVTPAPGHTGRLPFWTGDQVGRPYELGKAIGQFRREALADAALIADADDNTVNNVRAYLREQHEATGLVPDERTLVLERFTDEVGDWRIILHTPFGRPVNAAWALAVGQRVEELTGMDPQAVAGDDGIILRLPQGEREPDASLFFFDADEIVDLVTEQVGGSALFASRFRECAARALLLPKRNPGKRAPLWQQRQKAQQLLDVARKYPSFPIILETVRECLQDVYDLPALQEVLQALTRREIRIAEVTVAQPSPFASSLLFNYTGAFMYEGDSPLAEKRAAALALDPALLAQLLGTVELRELLDPEIIADVHAQLQFATRPARTAEDVADQLRILGPIPVDEFGAHVEQGLFELGVDGVLAALGPRAMRVRIGGRDHLAQALDAPLLRDGLGVPVPPGVPAQVETIIDALPQLASRWARTRGPFIVSELADAFGLSISAAFAVITGLDNVVEGHFRQGVAEVEYCAAEVLKVIRTRSLAAARAATEPVSATAFARFLPSWHQVRPICAGGQDGNGSGAGQANSDGALRGVDGVFAVIEQLAGVALPASAWESLILPARVPDYSPTMLDELTAAGEVLIVGAGKAGANDPWILLLPADYAQQLMPPRSSDPSGPSGTLQTGDAEGPSLSMVQQAILDEISAGGGFRFADFAPYVPGTDAEVQAALWELVEMGLVSPDSFAPVRAHVHSSRSSSPGVAHRSARRPQRTRLRMGRTSFAQTQRASTPPDVAGRWSLTAAPAADATSRSVAHGEAWLDRYGVVTRGSVVAEDVLGGFALAYKVLSRFEESGKAMRGYVIEGLGAAQFSTPAVIDRLRGMADSPDVTGWPSGTQDPAVYLLAACDPANPYGAALPWPEDSHARRAAGDMVIIADGVLLAHLTRGGKTLSVFFDNVPAGVEESEALALIHRALRAAVEQGTLVSVTIEKLCGLPALESPLLPQLRALGAKITPKGVRIVAGGASASARATSGPGTMGRAATSGRPATPQVTRGRSMREALESLGPDESLRSREADSGFGVADADLGDLTDLSFDDDASAPPPPRYQSQNPRRGGGFGRGSRR